MDEDQVKKIVIMYDSIREMDYAKAEALLAAFHARYPNLVELAKISRVYVENSIGDIIKTVEFPKEQIIAKDCYCSHCKAWLKKKKCRVCGTYN